jgi:hypothetical protein
MRERLGYGLDDRGSVSGRAVVYYLRHCVRDGCGLHVSGALTLRLGRLGVGLAAHLHLVPGLWSCASSPRFFMAFCLIKLWIILYVSLLS